MGVEETKDVSDEDYLRVMQGQMPTAMLQPISTTVSTCIYVSVASRVCGSRFDPRNVPRKDASI